ncbi:hypothetical protein [Candidatus Entotheonella palauensis]|uniref:EthD domain-containing protein n=1 Tax=Candidatus Entotheonella gemina TaxID=1429439 RepID=W4LP10_9BACT|nr:hypothetical protein [Candidatus Entotheonella palauensis]ETW99146.1 MAG: hypothetical protein ETSY2_41455 [Candidatus Entotheonella gemina]
MIFMSQSGITDPKQQAAWDRWYLDHLQVMLTVDGIESAQRFELLQGHASPSLAIYSIASPEVFQDAYYLRIRGMGAWLPLIDREHYHRNLFTGLDIAPEVPDTGVLLVADRHEPEPMRAGSVWTWLEAAGLDRSTPYRGIAVVPSASALDVPGTDVASYRPVTGRLCA